MQSDPQAIPAGVLVTVPLPDSAFLTVSQSPNTNVAVTVFAASIVTVHTPVPVHAPLQPVNADPLVATAVSLKTVPLT